MLDLDAHESLQVFPLLQHEAFHFVVLNFDRIEFVIKRSTVLDTHGSSFIKHALQILAIVLQALVLLLQLLHLRLQDVDILFQFLILRFLTR